ncbi:helix-turn-helix transcriptional regulator [Chryseobacterium sp.]|uniref:helix-turn-helix domain-containing protein n=1 Tax=Chryseobacterium sp. TaxID=1871047 RepID=UPI0025BB2EEE|nr:helix-turn-helix transcriptional regulator [Chryseobacterium sp.]
MKECGQTIRKIRRNRDFTQEYMAFEMGISQKAYSDIENSKSRMNLENLSKIAQILDIEPSEICSISGKCSSDCAEKYYSLIDYMRENNIPIPEEYL